MPEEKIVLECALPSCCYVQTLRVRDLTRSGWKAVKEAGHPPPTNNRGRTHLGFCPQCAIKFKIQ